MILLDTDVLIEIYDRESEIGAQLEKKIEENGEDWATTPINIHELFYGLFKYAGHKEEAENFLTLPFTKSDAILSAKLEYVCEKEGHTVEKEDCMIASVAINNGCKLYSLNKKHFSRFEKFGLRLF